MARFTIYSPTGTALYTGTPSFTGQYMKPGLLEFREVSVPTLLALEPGCYVDYARTGYRYRIYTVPQIKKQARRATYGGAFVFQGVQLYDASKQLEYCPFRDLVKGDNRIHFSTQPSISTFEGVDGLARRFEACLVDQYGAGSWQVRIATAEENPALHDLMLEPREFTVSGLNILECLDKIYEIWPEVGWIYKVENGKDTIVIGGGGANPNVGTYAYGKGNGLTSLTRVAANADEIANRIFAYGSSRNMLPRWYNSQDIKDAESVDIQNLMLPIGPVGTPGTPDYWPGWGETDGDRDAAKAFVENAASILKNGLRPATVYFDGKGEYPEIYPSIRETTIGMVRNAIGDSTAKYYPSTTIYIDPDARIDKLLSAQSAFDSGKAGADGKSSTDVGYIPYDHSGSPTPIQIASRSVHTEAFASGTISLTGTGRLNIEVSYPGIGILTGCGAVYLDFTIGKVHSGATTTIYTQRVAMNPGDAGGYSVPEGRISYNGGILFESGDSLSVAVSLVLDNRTGADDTTAFLANVSGTMTVKAYYHRDKTFTISLRQIGFDINEQADLGNGKTIAMRSGDCVGRSFPVKSAQYNATNDCWDLECWRTEDESLSQWFPNTDYPVRGLENAGQSNEYPGDEFVLLDIAMPDIYIAMASQKLLVAARDLLADSAVERWQYNPEIDAKYMVENARTINAGEAMTISDPDIIGESPESVIVDTITISEGESPIPTYKVTLRDRKKKTWTESAMPETSSSKSVGTTTTVQPTSTGGNDSFFQLDEIGNVTLKSQYQNLWVPGWLAAGCIGQGGSGGGGLISSVKGVADLNTPIASESLTETFSAYAIQSIYNAVRLKSTVALSNVLPYASGRVRVATLTIDGTNHDIYAPEPTGGGGVETETDPIFSASAAFGISTTDIANWNAKVSNVQSDWNAATGLAAILNKPSIPNEATVSGWGFTKNAGTVTSVGLTVPTGLSVSGSPVTASGTLAISFANGYSIPTTSKQSGWDAKYDKPSGGIPKTDLASAVQTSLGKADTALQSETDPTVPAWAKASSKPSYSLSEISGTDDLLAIEALTGTGFLKRTASNTWALDNTSYLPLAGGTVTGAMEFLGTLAGPVESGTKRYWWIYDDGSAVFDSVDAGSIFVRQLYIGQNLDEFIPSSYVTLAGAQTITGVKTFSGGIVMDGADVIPSADLGSQLGYSNRRFANINARTLAVNEINFKNSGNNARTGYLSFADGYMILCAGANIDSSNKQIIFHETYGLYPENGNSINLGYYSSSDNRYRWANIYGVNADLSGNLSLASSSHIDIGPLRIEYDATNKALHITKASSSDTNNYGIYADGFVAAGGIGQTS